MPVDLLARRASCDISSILGNTAGLANEASRLADEVAAGRWWLGRDGAELVIGGLGRWLGRSMSPGPAALAAAASAEWFLHANGASAIGSQSVPGEGVRMTLTMRGAGSDARALIIAP